MSKTITAPEAVPAPVANGSKEALAYDNPILAIEQALTVTAGLQEFPIEKLFLENNVRTPETERVPEMVESLKRHGFKQNHPLVVSLKAKGRGQVLCGNRRLLGILALKKEDPATFKRLFPKGTVPAVVHTNLNSAQEAIIRVDHGSDEDRVPLDAVGEFLAVRQLVKADYNTQSGIAAKLGKLKKDAKTGQWVPNRSWVQPRINLALLPTFVQDEFIKYWGNAESSPVRVSMIAGLFKTFNEEFATYPEGNGPAFKKLWKQCRTPAEESAGTEGPKPISPAECGKRAKLVGSRNLRDALMVVGGHTDQIDVKTVDDRMVRAEAAEATLAEIAIYLGEKDFLQLVTESRKAAQVTETQPTEEPVAAA